jgi:hypothetical protein
MSTFRYYKLFPDALCALSSSIVLFQHAVGLFAHYFFWTEWFHPLNIRCTRIATFSINICLIQGDVNDIEWVCQGKVEMSYS